VRLRPGSVRSRGGVGAGHAKFTFGAGQFLSSQHPVLGFPAVQELG
jgi:hypothetical protein